ncbi:DNA helicase RecQ [Fimbriiglobus ruber]|uniref:DNA helicase RecQ n=1 Tax=Fimbriiglobus ruber TaxID=1908690 RepID=A0A225DBC6_9BACT|nr:DNA helicase RecQ [Fimbriiglobus ruber]OWK35828.1 ATP-dependent DNA helicase RecQ [Fimbriiglobus ruber]
MPTAVPSGLVDAIARVWGFRSLRPLQEHAIAAVLARRDSLVVMPTGGGKSLCYQAPPIFRGDTTVVVSPLIALMKDQVDSLHRVGVPAVRFDSTQTAVERTAAENAVRGGKVPLVFASPERLGMSGFVRMVGESCRVRAVAVDEAHCISHWGHDFRPEYRQLGRLRELFPGTTIHAYTATATEKVRGDIAHQLGLDEPEIIVGHFDRPNLTFRVLPKLDVRRQAREVIDRNRGSAGIIYCLRRKDVEELAAYLVAAGYDAIGYHAGMANEERRAAQDRFAVEEAPIVVATIAFGMGIDRPDVRFVVHAAMPKTIEHYQQETGRAGRDSRPSECVLLYSGSDAITLRNMIEKSAVESGGDLSFLPAVFEQLSAMDRYCRGAVCRHRALVRHFGQEYEPANCKACDICLGDTQEVPDATVVAQKILSCVARVNQSFGVGHVVSVLRGESTDSVRQRGHDKVTTFGLLKEVPKPDLRDWVFQLIGHEVLVQTVDEYPILRLNAASWEVMKGQRPVRLIQLVRRTQRGRRSSTPDLVSDPSGGPSFPESMDTGLFDRLRDLRRQLAAAEQVPAYRIFPDSVLISLATTRPATEYALRQISGIGEIKLQAYGAKFLAAIRDYADGPPAYAPPTPTKADSAPAKTTKPVMTAPLRKKKAFTLFHDKCPIDDVMHQLQVARSTAADYLVQFIELARPADIRAWVADDIYQEISAAAAEIGGDKLKPIFDALGEQVPYDQIRWVLAHRATGEQPF